MPIILAIEPDRRQAAHLAGAVRQRVAAELVLAETTEEALDAIGNRVPDMVLVPALLSPQEDAALAAALRLMATAAHVRMLTIPVLANGTKRSKPGGMLAKWRRGRAGSPALDGCDPSVFADQINAYLEEAAAERAALEPEIGDEAEPWLAPTDADEPIAIAVTRTIEAPPSDPITFVAPEPIFLATPEPIAPETTREEAWAIEPIELPAEEPFAFAAPDPIVLATPEPIALETTPMEAWAIDPIEMPAEEPVAFAAPDPIVLATPEPIALETPPMEAWAIEPIEMQAEEPIAFAASDPIVLATPEPIALDTPPMDAWAIEPIEMPAEEPIAFAAPEPIGMPVEEPIAFAAPDPIVLATPEPIALETTPMEAWAIEPIEMLAEEPIAFAVFETAKAPAEDPIAPAAIEPITVAAPTPVLPAKPEPIEPAVPATDAWVIDLMETLSEEPVAFGAYEPVEVVSLDLDQWAADLDLWAATESIKQRTAAAFAKESPARSDTAPEPNPDGTADVDLSEQIEGLAKVPAAEEERLAGVRAEVHAAPPTIEAPAIATFELLETTLESATLAPQAGASTPGPTSEADGYEPPPLYVFDIEEYFVKTPVVQTPVVHAPVVHAPVVQAPPIEDPVFEEFVLDESEVEAPLDKTLAVARLAAEQPVVEAHIVDDMTMEEEETPGSDVERWTPMHLTPGRMWPNLQGIPAEAAPPPNASPARLAERPIAAAGRAEVLQPKARTGAAPRADHPEWHELIASLRQDIARRRSDPGSVSAPPIAAQSAGAGAGNVKRRVKKQKPFGRKPRPLQDEWGLFDPDQCGFSALLAKLEEITTDESDGRRP